MPPSNRSFRNFAWFLLGYNVLIILWGAFVRVSKSGDGCGSHWPTCNGEAFHIPDNFATLVEFTHRLSTAVDLPMIIVMLVWAFRAFPKKSGVRKMATAVLIFTLTEAAFGAVLVRYGLVVDNDSTARAVVLSAHLFNTFLLLGALTLTAWWGGGHQVPQWKNQGALGWLFAFAIGSTLLIGVSGSIAALGDTLFPATSAAMNVQDILQENLDPAQHILIRLRIFHPFLAIGVGFFLLYLASAAAKQRPSLEVRRLALATCVLFCIQLAIGLLNRQLLAPLSMQIIHLFMADVVWINLVLMMAATMATQSVPITARERRIARGAVEATQ